MKKTSFLNKLHKEGKLRLDEPSDTIKNAYIEKTQSYLASAKLLLEHDRLEESVSMAYYSMYYTSLALLFKTGIKSENHTATIILLKEIYGLDSTPLKEAKKERVDKQYYVDFKITRNETQTLIQTAETFNATLLDYIEKLTNQKIKQHHETFRKLTE